VIGGWLGNIVGTVSLNYLPAFGGLRPCDLRLVWGCIHLAMSLGAAAAGFGPPFAEKNLELELDLDLGLDIASRVQTAVYHRKINWVRRRSN